MKKLGTCCKVLTLALERSSRVPFGLSIETVMNFRTGATRDGLCLRWRKADKNDTGKYGKGKPYETSTWGEVRFCPFCGTSTSPPAKGTP